MTTEQWIPIKDYEGLYEVSSFGRVRSLDRVIYDYRGHPRKLNGSIRKPQLQPNGYVFTTLCKHSIVYERMVHRIVMENFFGYQDLDVNHKDFDKTNNNISNLEYCTRRENMIHCFAARKTTSKCNGISFNSRHKKWEAKIMYNGTRIYLGRYKDEQDAIRIHDECLMEIEALPKQASADEVKAIAAKFYTPIYHKTCQYCGLTTSTSNHTRHIPNCKAKPKAA